MHSPETTQVQVSNGTSRRAEWGVRDDIESWLLEQGVPEQCFQSHPT